MHNFPDKSEPRHSIMAGLFLVVAGSLVLAYKMGAPLPEWLFTWQVLLIAIGIMAGVKKRFSDFSWLIMIAVGSLFLIERMYPDYHIRQYIIPILVIFVGFCFIVRPRHFGRHDRFREFHRKRWQHRYSHFEDAEMTPPPAAREPFAGDDTIKGDKNDMLDSVSVFGAVRKKVVSKSFAGGEVTCFMGGAEIDLSQADIQGKVVLDLTQVFGGTKLIVPPHWDLQSEVAAVFGGVEDKRVLHGTNVDFTKVLVLKGTSVFGGIDIQSY